MAKTAEEFMASYAERSHLTVEDLQRLGLVPMPCECGEPGCEGWQMVSLPLEGEVKYN